jgi:ATP-binding cassette subfamily B protein
VVEGTWQLGALIAFSTYLGMATGPVNSLLGLYVAIQRMSVSLMRVSELREAPAEVVDTGEARPIPRTWQGRIEFDGVGFRHGGRAEAVLDGARLTIPAGSKLALTGASGAGKSTLIDLLHRHYDPQAGSIRLDGTDLRAIALGELRRAVAVVSQDIVLFRGTLADNIRYAVPQADETATSLSPACRRGWRRRLASAASNSPAASASASRSRAHCCRIPACWCSTRRPRRSMRRPRRRSSPRWMRCSPHARAS